MRFPIVIIHTIQDRWSIHKSSFLVRSNIKYLSWRRTQIHNRMHALIPIEILVSYIRCRRRCHNTNIWHFSPSLFTVTVTFTSFSTVTVTLKVLLSMFCICTCMIRAFSKLSFPFCALCWWMLFRANAHWMLFMSTLLKQNFIHYWKWFFIIFKRLIFLFWKNITFF